MKRAKSNKPKLSDKDMKRLVHLTVTNLREKISDEDCLKWIRNYCEQIFQYMPAKNLPKLVLEKAKAIIK